MKPRLFRPLTANVPTALLLAFAVGQINSSAAALTWDNDATFSNGVTDGSGTWDTSTPNWNNGLSNVLWANNETAVFGTGTVTLLSGISVGGLTFNTSSTTGSYIIGGGGTVNYIKSGPSTGSLILTGATFTTSGMNFYDFGADNNTTNGKVFQTGGTVTTSTDWDGRNKNSTYNVSGGTLTVTTVNRIRGLVIFNASGNAVVTFNTGDARVASNNVSGALSLNGAAAVTFSSNTLLNLGNGGNSAYGVINLGGDMLTAAVIHNGGGAGTTDIINFNGGTLRASGGGSGFFNANALTTVNAYGDGAIVDSNGLSIGISQPFLGTTGNGIDAVSVSAGGGYTNMPPADVRASVTGGLKALQTAAPQAAIFVIAPFGQYPAADLKAAVAASNGSGKISISDLSPSAAKGLTTNTFGGGIHPSLHAHATFGAQILTHVVGKLPAAAPASQPISKR